MQVLTPLGLGWPTADRRHDGSVSTTGVLSVTMRAGELDCYCCHAPGTDPSPQHRAHWTVPESVMTKASCFLILNYTTRIQSSKQHGTGIQTDTKISGTE